MKGLEINDSIKSIFTTLSANKTSEEEIYQKLLELKPEEPELIAFELLSELIAFEFDEKTDGEKSHWGTHFAPRILFTYENGSSFESPSLTKVTLNMIEYWEKRGIEENNPLIKARYFGLVFDLSEKFGSKKPSIELFRKYVDCLIRIGEEKLHSNVYKTFQRLKRALSLSCLYNQDDFIIRIKNALIVYEREEADDVSPGHWGYSFEMLVDNKKVKLSNEEESLIIEDIESRLKRLCDETAQNIKPWIAQEAAKYLATYYLKKGRIDDVRRVLLNVEEAYNSLIDTAPVMQASGWLEELHSLYLQFGQKDLSDKILIRLRAIGRKVADSLETITVEENFPREKIDNYITVMFSGSFEEILIRIANAHLPRKDLAKEELIKVSKENHLRFLFRTAVQDLKGRVVASIGPINHDLEGQLTRHISDSISFGSLLLSLCFKELRSRFELTPHSLFDFINRGKLIEESHHPVVLRGLEAYLNMQYMESIHVLIPQIEDALRNMYESLGGAVLKPYKDGKFQLKLLEELLREPLMIETLTEDLCLYFRILFTDSRGWNMRNNVCHGLYPSGAFNSQSADRLIHAFLCLGLFQRVENT